MKIDQRAAAALDALEDAELLHGFEDSVTLRVDRELWRAFCNAGRG